jgi:hypothetical protein
VLRLPSCCAWLLLLLPTLGFLALQAAEEALVLLGDVGALRTAWRVQENLGELSYTQFWRLVAENQVEQARWAGEGGAPELVGPWPGPVLQAGSVACSSSGWVAVAG